MIARTYFCFLGVIDNDDDDYCGNDYVTFFLIETLEDCITVQVGDASSDTTGSSKLND